MKTIKLEDNYFGYNYSTVLEIAKEKAIRENVIVEFEFNGRINKVSPTTDIEQIGQYFSDSFLMDWKEIGPNCSPYTEAQLEEIRIAREAQEKRQEEQQKEYRIKQQQERVEFAVLVEGIFMDLSNPEEWDSWKAKNTDPYGACCFEYAEGWARLMQREMATGKTLQECAELASHKLDFLGITGFMYGVAVSILSKCWKHGEELRKWHNKEYNHEGDGVVNPAILTIG